MSTNNPYSHTTSVNNSINAHSVDVIVDLYSPLVRRIAFHLKGQLPDSVQVDDLIQAGMIGLLEAHKNFSAKQGASFETYAGIRIRGAMLDEIRRSDWTPRSVHKKARMVSKAMHDIENRTGRDARDHEIAKALNIDLGEYYQILQDSANARLSSLEALVQDNDQPNNQFASHQAIPIDNLTQATFKTALADAIAGLPERERIIVSLCYIEEKSLREVGAILGLTESRTCQIKGQTMLRLRAKMRDWAERPDMLH